MIRKFIACAATVAGLSACAALSSCNTTGVSHAMEYKGSKTIRYTGPDKQLYRIFDKPDENRLMITPSLAASFGGGVVYGGTLGTVNPLGAGDPYRAAALAWLASTGRTCSATETSLILNPQWEVKYACGEPEPTIAPAPKAPKS